MNGAELEAQRRLLKLSQAGMAEAMGVSLRQYTRYEHSAEALSVKAANLVKLVTAQAAMALPRRDGRHKVPIDWAARGKPIYVYLNGQEIGHDPYSWPGDPSGRPRFKSLELALADPSLAGRKIDATRNHETDTEIHIFLN